MKNTKQVTNYWIELHKELGIYQLTFNTKDRWIPYHQFNDEMYQFGEVSRYDTDNETQEEWEARIQEVPEFLPKDVSYIPTSIQNKDQITYYFIPLKSVLNGTIIKHPKTKKDGK